MAEISKEIIKKIRRIEIQATHLVEDLLAGAYRSAFKGRGIEFEEVREYQQGDDIRTIDWNVTARMNSPYVKNFTEERDLTAMILVDVSSSSHFGSRQQRKIDLIAEIGAVLAFSAIKNHDKVGLILFSKEVEKFLQPKKGSRHVLHLIRELLTFQPSHKGTNIPSALNFLGKVQHTRSICFLISDFLGSKYSDAMKLIAKKHELIALKISDPIESVFPNIDLVPLKDLETGKIELADTSDPATRKHFEEAATKREELLKHTLKKVGGSLIEIQTDQPYIDTLQKFFKQRKERR